MKFYVVLLSFSVAILCFANPVVTPLKVTLIGTSNANGTYNITGKMGIIELLYNTEALKHATCIKHLTLTTQQNGEKRMKDVNVFDLVMNRLDDIIIQEDMLIAIPKHVFPCTSKMELELLLRNIPIYLEETEIQSGGFLNNLVDEKLKPANAIKRIKLNHTLIGNPRYRYIDSPNTKMESIELYIQNKQVLLKATNGILVSFDIN